MVIYRPQRRSLKQSLEESVEFLSFDKMKDYIVNNTIFNISKEDIEISSERFNDVRTGWENTRYIYVNRAGKDQSFESVCIGVCATVYVRPNNKYYKTKVHKYLLKIADAINRSSINEEHKSFVYVVLGNRYSYTLFDSIQASFGIKYYKDISEIDSIEIIVNIITRLYPYIMSASPHITNRISQSTIKKSLSGNNDLDMLFYDKCLNILKSCNNTKLPKSKYETPVHKYLIRLSKALSDMNIGSISESYYVLISNRYNSKTPEPLYRLHGVRYYYQLNTLDDRKLRGSVSLIVSSIKPETVRKYFGKSIINKVILDTLNKYDDIDMSRYSYSKLQWRNY